MASLKAADGVGGLASDNHEDASGQIEFDELLQSNVLDTLADFDFACADLSGTEVEAKSVVASTCPKSTGRKRSFSQACTWDNMAPKALTELTAGLLAGVWDNNYLPPTTSLLAGPSAATSNDADCSEALGVTRSAGDVTGPVGGGQPAEFAGATTAVHVKVCGEHGKGGPSRGGRKGCKGKRGGEGGGGGSKRPLNPDRMERKATREKRRREEVNQKFEQLLQVLEEAEATSGLEPPVAPEGQAGNACINGRRVEVLSRTITVVKKLLRDRRGSSSLCHPRDPTLSLEVSSSCLEDGDAPAPTAAVSTAVSVSDYSLVASYASATTASSSSPCSEAATNPLQAAATAAAAAAAAAKESAATPTMRMAMPLHGAHPSMAIPPGFAGISGAAMSAAAAAGMHHQHGVPGQPIFIAVPVYMPGQGMGGAGGATEGAAPHASLPPASAGPVCAAAGASTNASPAAVAPGPVKPTAGVGKEAWGVPPGMGLQSLTTLQMPHFVTQALSTEEGDEKPTHAVCA